MKIHELKTVQPFLAEVWNENKTFEYRKNDRDFEQGDHLLLQEYNEAESEYGNGRILCEIIYLLEGGVYGVPKGYCIMGIKIIYCYNN